MLENPLVSVCVITFNSSRYVLEALESVKKQTYQNIELIISDDCSTDNTVEICQSWLDDNLNRFVRVKLLKSICNHGVTYNGNCAIREAKGDWVKAVAGDDALLYTCVEKYVDYLKIYPNTSFVNSGFLMYRDCFKDENIICRRSYKNHPMYKKNVLSTGQFNMLLYACFVSTPTLFFNKKQWENVGGFDESIRDVEDWPFFLKITKLGYHIDYMDDYTLKYRVRFDSLSNERSNEKLFSKHYIRENLIYVKYIYPNINFLLRMLIKYQYFIFYTFDRYDMNRNTFYLKFLYRFLIVPSNYLKQFIWAIKGLNKIE